MPVNPLRTVFVRLNTSAHPFPRLHARSFSKAVHVWVGCGWRRVGDRILYSTQGRTRRSYGKTCSCVLKRTAVVCGVKFGDNTDCKIAWKCVDTERDLSTRWVYLNSKTAQSTHKGVNWRSKDVTQIQQQRPESPTITITWHACKSKVHKLHQRHILKNLSLIHI